LLASFPPGSAPPARTCRSPPPPCRARGLSSLATVRFWQPGQAKRLPSPTQ